VKVPHSWLRRLVDVDLPLDELVDVMGRNGLEVEEVHTPGAGTAGVRTARVLHRAPHPDADKLQVVRLTGQDGQDEVELVCGAWNFEVDDVVLHAPPGATIPGLTLEARAIRGVTSAGMICSARELELGDDHAGILVLPRDTPLGVELTDLIAIGEPVIEVAVQADRGDHLSVLGVARELGAILDLPVREPSVSDAPDKAGIDVALETDGVERFVAWTLEGVAAGAPSPLWLRHRLSQCGVRSIDAVVDVTNFVMLELGQPLHAFDLDRLAGPELHVRRSDGGEELVTLDDQTRTLAPGDLVIDDAERPASLAGVMGGRDTEVGEGTGRVLLEAAVWEPTSVRDTSRRLNLISEASQRFARGVDPEGAERAVARASDLLAELAGASATAATRVVAASRPAWAARPPVEVDVHAARRLIAVEELDADRQRALLERAGCEVERTDEATLTVTPPSWRADLTRPADVAEEVARLHGYDRIPASLPEVRLTGGLTASQQADRELRRLVLAAGFHEAVTRPFVGADAQLGVLPSEGRVELANPLAKDASAMRPSLLEGLLVALRRNVGQGRAGTALAEHGRVFRPHDDPLADALGDVGERWRDPEGAALPLQPRVLGLAAQGLRLGERWLDAEATWSVYDLLAVFDEAARRLLPPDDPRRLERRAVERPGFHPGRTAALVLDGHEVGLVGQLHPHEAASRDLPEPVVVGELVVEGLLQAVPDAGHPPVTARELVKHPAMTVDVALVAGEDVPYARLEEAVREGAGELLDGLWWFDEYRGEQVGEGRRSVAIRLRLQAPDRQLTDEDAERVIAGVADAAERAGATLRR
jgi:phenylalanyl-tRNA synthetase beta chain